MKKLLCMLAAMTMLFTACGGRNNADNSDMQDTPTENGQVTDEDGDITENKNDSMADDVADGVGNVVDGATDAVDDVVDGTGEAIDDMTGNDANDAASSNNSGTTKG